MRYVILPTADIIAGYQHQMVEYPFLKNGVRDLMEEVIVRRMERGESTPTLEEEWAATYGRLAGVLFPSKYTGVFCAFDAWVGRNMDSDFTTEEYFSRCGELDFMLGTIEDELNHIFDDLFRGHHVRIRSQVPRWVHNDLYIAIELEEV